MELTIDYMRGEEMDAVARVLGDAFVTNPNSIAVWRAQGDAERRKQAESFRVLKLQRPFARVLVARQGDEVVGALNMAPWPKCQMSGLDTAIMAPRLIRIMGRSLFQGAAGRAAQLQRLWGDHDPKQPHWHLGPVGVSTSVQGQGVGSRLMTRCCEFIDEEGQAAYLETDRPGNVGFYEKFGFRVTGEADYLGVNNWFMWREPIATSGTPR